MINLRTSPGRILMVDDNRTDVLLMERALKKVDISHEFRTAPDGQAATDLLKAGSTGPESSRPDLILLDLNMPRKDGFQVLKELKGDADLREIPVVIYSSSSRPEDVRRCYALHANSYVAKPVSYEDLIKIAKLIRAYWFESVLLAR